MKIHELKELYGLTLKQISEKTGIPYSRVCKLNKEHIIYSTKDYELIRKYIKNIGNNVIKVNFTPNTKKRVPFSWERRGEIDLNDYKNYKKDQQRAEKIKEKRNPFKELKVYHD